MTPRNVVIAFAVTVVAVVAGWFGGAAARDTFGDQYETAIGVVDAQAGIPVESATPTPTLTPTPTQTSTPSPTPSPSPSPTPEDTPGSILCEGAPPEPNCNCDLEDGEWVWQCGLPTASPTFPPEDD